MTQPHLMWTLTHLTLLSHHSCQESFIKCSAEPAKIWHSSKGTHPNHLLNKNKNNSMHEDGISYNVQKDLHITSVAQGKQSQLTAYWHGEHVMKHSSWQTGRTRLTDLMSFSHCSFLTFYWLVFSVCFKSLEHRLHSANHSLQATPNSTIHSLVHQIHPPLVDLWNTGQMETYQAEAGGYMGVAATVEPSLCVPTGEEIVGTEHSPLLEQQEEEEVKVSWTWGCIT